jgi:hypothetical protein
MPIGSPLANQGNGLNFLVAAGIVYEIIAKDCSSPQTAELNADKRAATLMKWVNIGVIESVVLVAIAAYIDPKHATPLIAGGAVAATVTYLEYVHAKKAGLASKLPGTEQW